MEPVSLLGIGACAGGPWPLWQLHADSKPSKLWPADDLSSYYSTVTGEEAGAAKLFCEAEAHLNEDEDDEAALEKALAAVSAFKEHGNARGTSDALRVVVHAHRARCQALAYSKHFGYKHDIRDGLRDAEQVAKKGLEAFRESNDVRGQASMQLSLAEISLEGEKRREAIELATDACGKFHKASDSKLEAVALLALSNIHFRGSNAKEALSRANEARAIFSQLGDRRGEAKSLHASAIAHALAFNVKGAVEMAMEALNIFRDLQLQRLEAMELHTIAKWQLAGERYREALPAAKEALALFEDTNYGKGWQASALRTVVEVYLARNETGGALRAVMRVLDRSEELEKEGKLKDRKMDILVKDALAHVHLARDEVVQALQAADEAWAGVQNDSRDKEVTAIVMQTWAKVHFRLHGDSAEAAQNYLAAAEVAKSASNVALQVSCYHGMWDVCMAMRDPKGAKEAAGLLGDCCRKCEIRWTLGEAAGKLLFARAFSLTAAWDNAFAELKSAMAVFSATGSSALEAAVYRDFAEIYESKGDGQEALQAYKSAQADFQSAGMCSSGAAVSTRLARLLLAEQEPLQAFLTAAKAQEMSKKALNSLGELQALLVLLQAATHVSAAAGNKQSRAHIVDQAWRAVKDAGKLSQKFGDRASEGAIAYYTAQLSVLQARASAREALALANDALLIFEELEDLTSQGHVRLFIAQIYNLQGKEQVKKAIEMARDAFQCFSQCGNEDGCAQAVDEMKNMGVNFMSLGFDAANMLPSMGSGQLQQQAQMVEDQMPTVVSRTIQPAVVALTEKMVLDRLRPIVRELIEEEDGQLFPVDTPFMDAGMDSLMAVQFRNDVAKAADCVLPATVVFDFPTLNALASHILSISS